MIRVRHRGGEEVGKGNYWNFSTGERVSLDKEGVLPGNAGTIYYKANPALILVAGPVLGLIYAAFLPFIGIAMVMRLAFSKLFSERGEGLSSVATFNWRPTEAYLAGRRHTKKRQEKTGRSKDEKVTGNDAE